ncbi:MAG: S8 family serine peptidase [Phycisphaerae bacterium]
MEDRDDVLIVGVWDGAAWREVFRRSSECCFRDYYFRTTIELEPYRNPTMQVRFGWQTDADNNDFFGVEIDNISMRYIGPDYTGETAYGVKSGTSMATPHVAGTAALLLANCPDMCLSELKYRLMWTGDPIPDPDRPTVSGRRLNAYNALTVPLDLTVLTPNGGEHWLLGLAGTITWWPCDAGPLDIYLA